MKVRSLLLLYFFYILSGLCIFIPVVEAQTAPNVWEVLRRQFVLNHEVTQPEVINQIHWIAAHPSYLQKLALKSEPYIYHIVTEIRKRKLPGELALIPMIESSYDPFAYSGMGAAGLWQLMPGTGTDLGLKQDWWYDGRRSIGPSTNAALNYLAYLNNFFNGDWLLSFAAYDSGEGTMSRIIKNSGIKNKTPSFWSLKVPQETKAYIPRLLALAEIIQNPERYKIQLPDIPHAPYFEEVNIGSQIDLNHAAKLAGISYKDLIKLNPGFNRWATAPYHPFKLLIPANKVESFSRNLANVPEDKRVSWTRHQVSAGDNLAIIAQQYHTTVNLIKELNQLKTNSIKKGQFILIPSSKNTTILTTNKAIEPIKTQHFIATQQYKVLHIVQTNESFKDLEKKYTVTIKDIRKWNNLNDNSPIKIGQQLIIWKLSKPTGIYTVKSGDTLSIIAINHNTNTSSLIQLNPGINNKPLHPGQKITLG